MRNVLFSIFAVVVYSCLVISSSSAADNNTTSKNLNNFNLEGFWAAENQDCENYKVLIQFVNNKVYRQQAFGKRSVWGATYKQTKTENGLEIQIETRIGIEKLSFKIISDRKITLLSYFSNAAEPVNNRNAINFFTLNKC